MAVKKTVFLLLLIMFSVIVKTKQPISPEASPEEKVVDAINKQKDEIKKQEEDVKNLVDRIAAEIEREYKCTEEPAPPASSCKEQYEKYNSTKSQVYTLMFGSQTIPVYCHMGNFGCGDGGWTLAMKIDGTKRTFHYSSPLWGDRNSSNSAGGKTGFDQQETKLPTYWSTPFSKICLGMRIGHQKKFDVINKHANSLYSLIADGQYRPTSLGRNTWKRLIGSEASLQTNCNKEGFNAVGSDTSCSKARIGIISNQEGNCGSCDSRIGFGTGGFQDDSNTCGNEATYSPDNGNQHIKAMGYILVQ